MKLGFGLYRHMLNRRHYDFARQCGASAVIVHLVDYFNTTDKVPHDQPIGGLNGWGFAGDEEKIWSVEDLRALRREINDAGLEFYGIENFDPAHWYDILLDGPRRAQQIDKIKQTLRNLGAAGIPCMGYNFSIAGVAGRKHGPIGRAHSTVCYMDGLDEGNQAPIRKGMVWNMIYGGKLGEELLPQITHDELWRRLRAFLQEVTPVAEESGVRLAAHPDDPPLDRVRQQPRLVYQPHMFDRILEAKPSPNNALELCLGTVAEMTEGCVYDTVDRYTRNGSVAYIHLRNVAGKVPHYRETFIDEGDIDVPRVLRILERNHFDGVVIPDHAPQMSCDGPWYAGMAYAMGYLRAAMPADSRAPDRNQAATSLPRTMGAT
jgi:mannonate dehydratase